ncbi:MAG: Hsp20/alpha crystallin family protein [Bacilli bacterium]
MYMPSIFRESLLDDLLDFDNSYRVEKKLYGSNVRDLMKVDIKESDSDYQLLVDLPGFKKEDLTLDLTNGYLTITANKILDEEENKKFIRKERFYGKISRSFYVGENFKKEDIKAKFDNGVLILTLPKIDEKGTKEEPNNYIAIED